MKRRALSAILLLAPVLSFAIWAQTAIPMRARSRGSRIPAAGSAFPTGVPLKIATPLGLPPVPIPADNPPTAETVALGRKLFFDPILSRDSTVSCASCHDPKHGFADPRQVSEGVNRALGRRNAPTVLNAAYNPFQFWDGRVFSLEEQAAGPVGNPLEMAHSLAGVERKLMANPAYVDLFASAWGQGRITYEMVAKSIASYERTLVSGNSPFDRYYYKGDKTAMSESAIRGLQLYLNPSLKAANCVSCHRIDNEFSTFVEPRFHNTGVAFDPVGRTILDTGRYGIDGNQRLLGAFKTPTLRNIELTAPYMHNGSMKTLEEVIDFYFEGGRVNPSISNDMPAPGLPDIPKDQQAQAKKDLVEFMKALTGDMPPNASPPK
jgi:cytochrome c peroxidase